MGAGKLDDGGEFVCTQAPIFGNIENNSGAWYRYVAVNKHSPIAFHSNTWGGGGWTVSLKALTGLHFIIIIEGKVTMFLPTSVTIRTSLCRVWLSTHRVPDRNSCFSIRALNQVPLHPEYPLAIQHGSPTLPHSTSSYNKKKQNISHFLSSPPGGQILCGEACLCLRFALWIPPSQSPLYVSFNIDTGACRNKAEVSNLSMCRGFIQELTRWQVNLGRLSRCSCCRWLHNKPASPLDAFGGEL